MEPRGTELINRYKRNYKIPDQVGVTEQMILEHWELEKTITQDLWKSQPANRWEVFEQAYTLLYTKLDWLNAIPGDSTPPVKKYKNWLETIDSPPKKIYEIGSGKGDLISYLAECGFVCRGTEITKERGSKHVAQSSSYLTWGNTDGINLHTFEPANHYDVVISNQVIEHFHPDDLQIHLQNAYIILNENGRYIFSTPHCHTGPHDISFVFKYAEPQGMHLKEYTYHELVEVLNLVGFKNIHCNPPSAIKKLLSKIGIRNHKQITKVGIFYLKLMLIVEKLIFLIPSKKMRRPIAKGLRKLFIFADNIFLTAEK